MREPSGDQATLYTLVEPLARLAVQCAGEEGSQPQVKAIPRLVSVSMTISLTPSGPRMWSQSGP
jgi:hypothetical protein